MSQLQEIFFILSYFLPSSAWDFAKSLDFQFPVFSGFICITRVLFQFLALGTHFGKVFLLDIQGNITQKFEIVSTLIHTKHIMMQYFRHTGTCGTCTSIHITNINITLRLSSVQNNQKLFEQFLILSCLFLFVCVQHYASKLINTSSSLSVVLIEIIEHHTSHIIYIQLLTLTETFVISSELCFCWTEPKVTNFRNT